MDNPVRILYFQFAKIEIKEVIFIKIQKYTCGVYKITNIITNEFYIGSSVDIRGMWYKHTTQYAKKYKDVHRFYNDIFELGRENFKQEIVELCDREDLITREQYYYDTLSPQYNKVRPTNNYFEYEEVLKLASKNSNDEEHVLRRRELYNTLSYLDIFRNEIHKDIMREVDMIYNGKTIETFSSLRGAGRWIKENTSYSAKSSQTKIKEVCDGKRKSIYGYNWKYRNV